MTKKTWAFVIFVLTFLLSLATAFVFNSDSTNAEVKPLGGNFNIEVANKYSTITPDEVLNYHTATLNSYKWQNSRRIILTYIPDMDNLPNNDKYDRQIYTMNVDLEFLKGYTDSDFSSHITIENVYEETGLIPSTLYQTFEFDIDVGKSISNTNIKAQGWGIYRFKITINGSEKYSDYVFISPNYKVEKAPSVKYEVVHSPNSMHDSFKFSIANSNNYNFVDTNYITWYVTGESTDGKKIVLTKQDLDSERFSEYDSYLYIDINRNGSEFLFNDNEIAGKWKVWCEFTNREEGGHTSVLASTNVVDVQTSKNVKLTWVIWVVLGASALAVVGVVGFALYRNKKEKVW